MTQISEMVQHVTSKIHTLSSSFPQLPVPMQLVHCSSEALTEYKNGFKAICDQEEKKQQKLEKAGKVAQRLRALTALVEDQGLLSSTYIMAHNHL